MGDEITLGVMSIDYTEDVVVPYTTGMVVDRTVSVPREIWDRYNKAQAELEIAHLYLAPYLPE